MTDKALIEIVWQSRIAIAVDKPAGLPTTAAPGIESVETRLAKQLPDLGYLTAVHRLDRDVGGILLLAKTKKAARLLSEQFAARKVRKTYLAWVDGEAIFNNDVWVDYVRKLPDQAKGEICSEVNDGAKRAETHVRSIRYDRERNCTLLELCPLTGRMHQLRLQTAGRRHPIRHDPIYGPASLEPAAPRDGLICLTAHRLEFRDPGNGQVIKIATTPEGYQ
ncbi:RluA family pseudouridine synthase [Neorhodopirellula pilleata]|uniref:RluA family pseudouridine synthase n=1 Tax=Neorhodopirellula pilleata TaxID=2714738 RepID=UPI001E48BC81|nr:RNA pseudouridine synthase [Neorhodopirellula pilleata]